ncbi:MAG: tetratricopeptide repeat protein [Crocinitomicaceae bacterium]
MRHSFLSLMFLLSWAISHSQSDVSSIIDSLKNCLEKSETVKDEVKLLNTLAMATMRMDTIQAVNYAERAFKLSKEVGFLEGELGALNFFARNYTERGKMDTALMILQKIVLYEDKVDDKKRIADAYVSMGNIYDIQGDFPKGLAAYFKAKDIFKENKHWRGVGMAHMGIGNIYYGNSQFQKSINHFRKSANILRQINDPYTSWSINNMAGAMMGAGMTDSAEFYYKKSLRLKEDMGDVYGASFTYSELGELYLQSGKIKLAKEHLEKAVELKKQVEGIGMESMGKAILKLGKVAAKEKNYNQAIALFEEAKSMAFESSSMSTLISVYKELSIVYSKTGNYKSAFKALEEFTVLRDSLKNIESVEKLAEVQTQYETAEKEAQIQLMKSQDELNQTKIQKAEEKSKRTITMFIGALVVVIFLSVAIFFAYRSNKVKKKANSLLQTKNKEITQQKELVEEKSKEILDSIIYAKRIQSAILPPLKDFEKLFPESFVLYKPKDIVAGDFYWLETVASPSNSPEGGEPATVLFAAADCTGHGVPGAMVSVICNNGLNRSVREYGLTEPGQILDKTRAIVIKEFEKSEEDVKDGMDIALCSLSFDSNSGGVVGTSTPLSARLKYAGAHNPLWIIRKDADEVEEIKADKQPIGKYTLEEKFTTHKVEVNSGDTIYIFSDGYADQFGGEKGKKLKLANFKKFLLSIKKAPMNEQKEKLDEYFMGWKGDLEQLDDVCVIGVRV